MKMSKALHFVASLPARVALLLITFYRAAISPLLPSSCRFYPTCSEYGIEAIREHGFLKGIILLIKRLLRCRPGGPYGYDPVPHKEDLAAKPKAFLGR